MNVSRYFLIRPAHWLWFWFFVCLIGRASKIVRPILWNNKSNSVTQIYDQTSHNVVKQSQNKHLCNTNIISDTVAARSCNFAKERSGHHRMCFFVNWANFSRAASLQNFCKQLIPAIPEERIKRLVVFIFWLFHHC